MWFVIPFVMHPEKVILDSRQDKTESCRKEMNKIFINLKKLQKFEEKPIDVNVLYFI